VAADTIKYYSPIRQNNEAYSPKLKISIGNAFEAMNKKGLTSIEPEFIPKQSEMKMVFRVRGLWISGLMVTVQVDAHSAVVNMAAKPNAKALFADDAEPADETEADNGHAAKKAKVEQEPAASDDF